MIVKIFKSNDCVDNYLNVFDIFEYEKDKEEYWNNREIASKHLVENNGDEIWGLNTRIKPFKNRRKKFWKKREDE